MTLNHYSQHYLSSLFMIENNGQKILIYGIHFKYSQNDLKFKNSRKSTWNQKKNLFKNLKKSKKIAVHSQRDRSSVIGEGGKHWYGCRTRASGSAIELRSDDRDRPWKNHKFRYLGRMVRTKRKRRTRHAPGKKT